MLENTKLKNISECIINMTMAMKIDEERDIAELKKSVSAVRKGRNKGNDAFF